MHYQHVKRSSSTLFEPVFCPGPVETSPCSTQNNNKWTKAFSPSTKQRESQDVLRKSSWLQVRQKGDDETVRNIVVKCCFGHCYSVHAIVMSLLCIFADICFYVCGFSIGPNTVVMKQCNANIFSDVWLIKFSFLYKKPPFIPPHSAITTGDHLVLFLFTSD